MAALQGESMSHVKGGVYLWLNCEEMCALPAYSRGLYLWLVCQATANGHPDFPVILRIPRETFYAAFPDRSRESALNDLQSAGLLTIGEPNPEEFLFNLLSFESSVAVGLDSTAIACVWWTPPSVGTQGDLFGPTAGTGEHSKVRYRQLFEHLWERYPRRYGVRQGKKDAFRYFSRTVYDASSWKAINTAMKNYLAYLHESQIEERYILKASSWFNHWQDWFDRENPRKAEGKTFGGRVLL
jgi:hypothetical protein